MKELSYTVSLMLKKILQDRNSRHFNNGEWHELLVEVEE